MSTSCFILFCIVLLAVCDAQPPPYMINNVRAMPPMPSIALTPVIAKLTPAPRLNKPTVCMQENFETLDECCMDAPYDLVAKETRHTCYKELNVGQINQLLETSRQYFINRWQTAFNYTLDVSSMIQFERRERVACFMDCLFKAQGLITGSSLKLDAITDYYKRITTNPLVLDAVTICSKSVPALLPSLKFPDKCNSQAFIYVQCLWKEILLTCTIPTTTEANNSPTYKAFVENCNERRNTLKNCEKF